MYYFIFSVLCVFSLLFGVGVADAAVEIPSQLRVGSVSPTRATLRWQMSSNTEYAVFNAISGVIVQDFTRSARYTARRLKPENNYAYWVVARRIDTKEMSRIPDALQIFTPPVQLPVGEKSIIDPFVLSSGRDTIVMGTSTAPISLIVYTDFSCPFCKTWHKTLLDVLKNYPDKVKVVYRNFPLTALHPDAALRAKAVYCANTQRVSEKFLSSIFTRKTSDHTATTLGVLAESAGLNITEFSACLSNEQSGAWRIAQDKWAAGVVGAKGTPFTVMSVRGKKYSTISGSVPQAELERIVSGALEK